MWIYANYKINYYIIIIIKQGLDAIEATCPRHALTYISFHRQSYAQVTAVRYDL